MVNIPIFIGFHTGGAGFQPSTVCQSWASEVTPISDIMEGVFQFFSVDALGEGFGKKIPRGPAAFSWGETNDFFAVRESPLISPQVNGPFFFCLVECLSRQVGIQVVYAANKSLIACYLPPVTANRKNH